MQFGGSGNGNREGATSIGDALEFATNAIEGGDLKRGKAALNWVLQREPDNATAWFWMACCVEDENQKQECYRRGGA